VNTSDETIIELSRKKVVLLVLGSCIFVATGIWMLSLDAASIQSLHRGNPMFVHGVGLASIIFFGLCAIIGFRKLLDKKPGLVFRNSGIIDNASGVSAGLIPWAEIIGTKTLGVRRQILIIEVKDPQKYLERGHWLKRLATKANYKMCGSPITIPAITLKTSFPELLPIFDHYRQRYGSTKVGD
jgi:hypothetical protein